MPSRGVYRWQRVFLNSAWLEDAEMVKIDTTDLRRFFNTSRTKNLVLNDITGS